MRFVTLFLLSLFFYCCTGGQQGNASQSDSTDESAKKYSIEIGKRVGAITGSSTLEDIQKAYGKQNVQETSIHIAEGEMGEGLKLFPGSDNELELVWDTQVNPHHPAFIRIRNKNTSWKTVEGITLGTSLEELHQLNKAHFLLNGFEWDYGGLVTSWRGGNLNPNLIITLQPQHYNLLKPQFIGEVELSSDNPEVRALGLQVRVMVLTFLK